MISVTVYAAAVISAEHGRCGKGIRTGECLIHGEQGRLAFHTQAGLIVEPMSQKMSLFGLDTARQI